MNRRHFVCLLAGLATYGCKGRRKPPTRLPIHPEGYFRVASGANAGGGVMVKGGLITVPVSLTDAHRWYFEQLGNQPGWEAPAPRKPRSRGPVIFKKNMTYFPKAHPQLVDPTAPGALLIIDTTGEGTVVRQFETPDE